ncbi:MAG TPA: hypothetical protein VER12_17195 [Polyangiaceae bacterium]|nr:hypothetical protein [Polyangiaceae bacterium]
MRISLSALRRATVTYSRAEALAVALIAAVVAGWTAVAAGGFSVRALIACEVMFFTYYLTGSLFGGLRHLLTGILFDLPLRLLVGYGLVNTALFALAWLSPLGILANFGLLFALVLGLFFAAGRRELVRSESAGLWLVALCLVAATLWCGDSIHPRSEQDGAVVFKPWVDGFYHAVHIRIFGASHGATSIEDFRLAGISARPYHYGMYLLPAFIKQASGIHSYAAFAGVLAPVGVLFTGLGAYAFFGSLWGAWSGLAAAMALLLLPDGAQQGMQNPFMSYHWLTQISPSATYGLALLAVAWLFVIKGCTAGNRSQLFTGWSFVAIVMVYKLHYVFGNALLLLLVPPIFFRAPLTRQKRVLWIVAAFGIYVAGVVVGRRVPGVPLIRFDGSCVGEILRLILSFARPGALRDFVLSHMGSEYSAISNLSFGIPYVALAMLGLFLPLLVVLIVRLWRRGERLYVVFPLLLLINFLAMFFGLALDFSSSTPDELSHRPLLIVYFFVVAWCGGALASTLLESRRLTGIARPALIGLATVLMVVPAYFGRGVQQMWAMPHHAPVRVPLALVRVVDYIRSHGGSEDIVQHSQFDRIYALAALSERRSFVSHTMTRMPFRSEMIDERTNAVDHFMGLRRAKAVHATARAFGFRWFLLERGDRIDWPAEIADHPVLEAEPFKLYEF